MDADAKRRRITAMATELKADMLAAAGIYCAQKLPKIAAAMMASTRKATAPMPKARRRSGKSGPLRSIVRLRPPAKVARVSSSARGLAMMQINSVKQ